MFALDGILIGAGDTRFLKWSMVAAAAVYVPVAVAEPDLGWGIVGVWCGLLGLNAVRLVTCAARFRAGTGRARAEGAARMRWCRSANLCKARRFPHQACQTLIMTPMSALASRPLGLSTSQAARELGVSLGTIRRWSDAGFLKGYRTPGGQRRFSRDQIERFVRSLGADEGVDEGGIAA